MKKFSLQPTDDNALDMLISDSLDRNVLLFKFIELIGKLDDECWTIAVNGDWGSGKTFFVKQAKLIFDALNPQSKFELTNELKNILPENIREIDSVATVYYDAWLNDNHDDPILSLVYATIASNQSNFSPDKMRNILKIVADFVTFFYKRNMANLVDDCQGNDLLKNLKVADNVTNMVRNFVDSLINELGNRLVIFIDELDRCKPDYAIRFLERIKHYFDDNRITFVFSVNLLQLQSTVKNYYGANFEATRYLDKFFDLRCSLPTGDIEQFMRMRLSFSKDTIFEHICIETTKNLNFTLRECEHYVRLVKIVHNSNKKKALLTPDKEFALKYIVPILIGLQMVDVQELSNVLSGKSSQMLLNILLKCASNDLRREFFTGSLSSNSTKVSIADKLNEVYNAVFAIPNWDYAKEAVVANIRFSRETKKFIEETMSLLSTFSNYDD